MHPRPARRAKAAMRPARALVCAALLAATVASAATFAPAARAAAAPARAAAAPTPAAAAPTPAAAQASRPAAAAVPQFEHVIVVIMENKSADRASDPVACPFTAEFAKSYAWFQESYAITHPSQPNYLALWAASTLGVTDNSCPARGSPFDAENFGHALEAAKRTWRAYSEALPGPGATACRAQGDLYTRKHAPWTQFGNLDHRNERPYTDLAGDIAGHALPDLAFVVPDNCHNSHSCSASTGDKWLASELTTMMGAAGRRGLLVLTFDEDDHSSDNHILTVFAGPLVRPGTSSARRITHYTLVRTLCDGLGIPPFGEAVNEKPITDVWYRVAAPRTEPSKP
jgi:phospholipase C